MNHEETWLAISLATAAIAALYGFIWGRLTAPAPDASPRYTDLQVSLLETRFEGKLRVLEIGIESKFKMLGYTISPLERRTSILEDNVRVITRKIHDRSPA